MDRFPDMYLSYYETGNPRILFRNHDFFLRAFLCDSHVRIVSLCRNYNSHPFPLRIRNPEKLELRAILQGLVRLGVICGTASVVN